MNLQALQAFHFKSYSLLEALFHPRLNILVGDNGQGKTNILDMIYYLSLCKSPLRLPDSAAIQHEMPNATLHATYLDDAQRSYTVAMAIRRGAGKEVRLNDIPYERISEHIGRFPMVAIYPQDIDLTADGGDLKRRFMNATISQYEHEYLTALQQYEATLAQRNALLKTRGGIDHTLWEIIDEKLVTPAAIIFRERKLLCERIAPLFRYYYARIAQDAEQPELCYRTQLEEGEYRELLYAAREADMHLGHTSVGIHRDSIDFAIDGYLLRREGSQGQQKTFVVALKLAQYAYISEILKEKPILLLDDIFDRFDSRRIEQLLALLAEEDFGQVFITDTAPLQRARERIADLSMVALYNVEKSALTPCENV